MATSVARYKPQDQRKNPIPSRVRTKIKYPWSNYLDARAVMAVVVHLHCSCVSKLCVRVEDIHEFIIRGNFKALSRERKTDVLEAFEGRRDSEVAEMLTHLVSFLAFEGALIPEREHSGEVYRICTDELRVLDSVHERMYPVKYKKLGVLVLV